MIEQHQIEQFQRDGYLVVEGVLSMDEVAALQHDFDQWVEESRRHDQGWGTTVDGRALAVNAEMARIVGCADPEEALSDFTVLASQLYVDPQRRQEFINLLRQTKAVNHFEYEGKRKDGRRIWISMNARLTSPHNIPLMLKDNLTFHLTIILLGQLQFHYNMSFIMNYNLKSHHNIINHQNIQYQ